MIDVDVLEEGRDGTHVVFSFSSDVLSTFTDAYAKACEYQELILDFKLYKECMVIAGPDQIHAIAFNTKNFLTNVKLR